MKYIAFEDVVNMSIDEASERFAPNFSVNESDRSILMEYCKALDILAKRLDATEFSANVDDEKKIVISVSYPMISVSDANNLINQLFHRSVEVVFSYGDDSVVVDFTFPSIWENAIFKEANS